MSERIIKIYTDGACHTQLKVGGWASVIFIDDEKLVLKGNELNTTHNRMEILAVIKAVEYMKMENIGFKKINIYSDSQYVVNITDKIWKLKRKEFLTKKKVPIQNSDLVQALINVIETNNISFIKVIAHQKPTETVNYNREVDKMARKMIRDYVKNKS